jgi:hypothetical protein
MDIATLERAFARLGASARFRPMLRRASRAPLSIDVVAEHGRELFDIEFNAQAHAHAVSVAPHARHLLLHALTPDSDEPFKFLCGHDERHWFVAGIPNDRGVRDVATAMEALKPIGVQVAQRRLALDASQRSRRKNPAFLRQGEWFFVPAPNLHVDPWLVLKKEPLRRSLRAKPHTVDEAYRCGGETVMVSHLAPIGLSIAEHAQRLRSDPSARNVQWRPMRRNPDLYVRGRVRHADHATITLPIWHRVYMNEEARAPSSPAVAFLD